MKTEDELRAMTIAQLRAYANDEGIDLGGSSAKDDIILAIMEAEEGAEGRADTTEPPLEGGEPDPPLGEGDEKPPDEPLMGQEDLAATIGGTAPLVARPVIEEGVDPAPFQGEPTAELAKNEVFPVASTEEYALVSVGEADKDLMPPSVLEVLNAQNMPYTEEALRAQEEIHDPGNDTLPEGEGSDNEVRASGGTDSTRGTVRSA